VFSRFRAFVILFSFTLAPASAYSQMKAHRDFSGKPKDIQANFAHIRPNGAKTTYFLDDGTLHFWIETGLKTPERHGIYSRFTLAGDFEVAAAYDWNTADVPKAGYGVSCGIQIEFEDKGRMIALARGYEVGKGDAYIRTIKTPGKKDYETRAYATQAKKGRLVVRRVQSKISFLAADGDDTLVELESLKSFTAASVRKLIFFSDPGGEPNSLDCKLSDIHVRAQEIAGDIPESERVSYFWWYVIGIFVMIGAWGAYVGYRRWQDDKWLWSRE
jgi:hypothetical protein